jgi:regulator of sigma E protease
VTALAIVAAVLAVSLLIIVHEAGHFVAARRFGMRVERFSVGFGPVLFAFRRGATEFAISALPLGGYVRIAGMGPGEAEDASDRGLFANQAAWRRFLVILAGPAMNYLAAIAIGWYALATFGLPAPDPAPRVGRLVEGMPAQAAGLRPGDTVSGVAGVSVESWEGLVRELRRHPGEAIAIDVVRPSSGAEAREGPSSGADAQRLALPITLTAQGAAGFQQAAIYVRAPPGRALVDAVRRTNANAAAQLAAFGALFRKKPSAEGAVGPAGIVQQLVQAAREGAAPFLGFVWTISVVLAILNLLPVPALDGGRLVFLGYEIVARRRVDEKVESYVHLAGFVLLIGLILAVTVFGDLPRLLHR